MSNNASVTNILDRGLVKAGSESSRFERALIWRAALILAIAATAAAAAVITAPAATAAQMDPDLVRLLRTMVGIKGIIALVAAGLVYWRLGHSPPRLAALGYGASLCVSVAALVWLWGLASIPFGALLFYSGLVGLILVGRLDCGLLIGRVRPDAAVTRHTDRPARDAQAHREAASPDGFAVPSMPSASVPMSDKTALVAASMISRRGETPPTGSARVQIRRHSQSVGDSKSQCSAPSTRSTTA